MKETEGANCLTTMILHIIKTPQHQTLTLTCCQHNRYHESS